MVTMKLPENVCQLYPIVTCWNNGLNINGSLLWGITCVHLSSTLIYVARKFHVCLSTKVCFVQMMMLYKLQHCFIRLTAKIDKTLFHQLYWFWARLYVYNTYDIYVSRHNDIIHFANNVMKSRICIKSEI